MEAAWFTLPGRPTDRVEHVLYREDCSLVSRDLLLPGSVDVVVTSPPYNLGKDYGTARDDATYTQYLDWVAAWCDQLWREPRLRAPDRGRSCN